MALCENGEYEFQVNMFSPMANFTAAKLLTCLLLEQSYNVRNLDLENDFKCTCPTIVRRALQAYVHRSYQGSETPRLKRFNYCVNDAAMIWNLTIFQEFEDNGFSKMEKQRAYS